jgi:hypothetical protein
VGRLRNPAAATIICMLEHHADKEPQNGGVPYRVGDAAAAAFSRDGGVGRLSTGDDLH